MAFGHGPTALAMAFSHGHGVWPWPRRVAMATTLAIAFGHGEWPWRVILFTDCGVRTRSPHASEFEKRAASRSFDRRACRVAGNGIRASGPEGRDAEARQKRHQTSHGTWHQAVAERLRGWACASCARRTDAKGGAKPTAHRLAGGSRSIQRTQLTASSRNGAGGQCAARLYAEIQVCGSS